MRTECLDMRNRCPAQAARTLGSTVTDDPAHKDGEKSPCLSEELQPPPRLDVGCWRSSARDSSVVGGSLRERKPTKSYCCLTTENSAVTDLCATHSLLSATLFFPYRLIAAALLASVFLELMLSCCYRRILLLLRLHRPSGKTMAWSCVQLLYLLLFHSCAKRDTKMLLDLRPQQSA